jgi:FkbM family methyltransferase
MRRIVRRGRVALDIGAHWGLHTVLLSDLVGATGRVVAFEPSPMVLPSLSHTVGLLANTTLSSFALSDSVGTAPLFVPAHADMAGLSNWARAADRDSRRFDVRVDRLDRLVAAGVVPPPDFVKCDVEGFEARVFRGAASVLDRRQAPIALFEVNPRAAAEIGMAADAAVRVLDSLGAASYRFFSITSGELVPLERTPTRFMNALAIPEERMSVLSAIQTD